MISTAIFLGTLADHYARSGGLPPILGATGGQEHEDVRRAVDELCQRGYLARRADEVVPGRRFFERTVLGRVRAGAPETALACPQALTIDRFLIDAPECTLIVRVRQDSLGQAGILCGDLAVVDTRRTPGSGDLVVLVEDGVPVLAWHETVTSGSERLGVVTGIVRRLKSDVRGSRPERPARTFA